MVFLRKGSFAVDLDSPCQDCYRHQLELHRFVFLEFVVFEETWIGFENGGIALERPSAGEAAEDWLA